MPNRILRETILDSEKVNKLSPQAEVFYRRLMSVVDDFGRFDARPSVLKARCYPLKLDEVREADISRWTAECEKAGLIVFFNHDNKPYLWFPKLGEPRAKTSKYPAPPADATACAQTPTNAPACAQTRADVPYSYSPTYSDSSSDSFSGDEKHSPKELTEREQTVATWTAEFLLRYKGPKLELHRLHEDCRNAFGEVFDKVAHDKVMPEIQSATRSKMEFVHQLAKRLLPQEHKNDGRNGTKKPTFAERLKAEMERSKANDGR